MRYRAIALALILLGLLSGSAAAQDVLPDAQDLPVVIPPPATPLSQSLEFGVGLGRYEFEPGGETSGFDTEFARYARTRQGIDTWRLGVARQAKFDATSLEGGVGYTRYLGVNAISAGLSGGTSEELSHKYRFDLGITRPVAGFNVSAGYMRTQSHGENSSHGWSLGVNRWLDRFILAAGVRVDYGQPGDTRSSAVDLGITWYQWRQTYLGAGVSFGSVAYQLIGPGTPLSANVLADYDSWTAFVALTRYLGDDRGFNLRYDHTDAKDTWTIDGVTASYFREW